MRTWIILFFIFSTFSFCCLAQKNNGNSDGSYNKPAFDKKIPLYVHSYPVNPCNNDELLSVLRDSLAKEGFVLIDSIKRTALQRDFEGGDLHRAGLSMNSEKFKQYLETTSQTKKIYQELSIQNFSCLDTLHNYTIRTYLFPRPRTDEKGISFTLPFNSPYRISDIILSLIEREPHKK